ncbi:MAG: sulfite exporter TauE/SafE family protein [Fibrobacteraceae bacterium]|nr:sulfite exporter TauE/SafE family protein [Fibrobacteraceae bacterium]
MEETSLLIYLAFFGVGCAASMLNSIAGGGSVFSLPIMIFLGLPPTIANGTNRIGLIVGNISSAYNLHRHGHLNKKILFQLALPSVLGALAGVFFVVRLNDKVFQAILAVAIALVAIMSGLKKDILGKPPLSPPEKCTKMGFLGFLLVAIYGSIVQVGVGFLQIFALRRYTGLELIQVNALKNTLTTIFLIISTTGLAIAGKIHWPLAIVTALGAYFGGFLSSLLQCKKGNKFIERTVRIATVAVAIKMIYDVIAS